MSRWIPRLIIIAAVAHIAVGLASFDTLGEIVSAGVVNAADGFPRREAQLWFILAGIGFLCIGTLSASMPKLPRQLGWYLIGMGVPITLLWLVSGGPVLIVLGVLVLVTTRAR
ncbi:DUF6463 family protein [Nonomuraea sp. NPDC050536]|uniref:DUF6463 family protein n=1 Tax=Nonomuraea sp. NPDC050536 TaxID=3364366 RepID=UPI0037CB4AA1